MANSFMCRKYAELLAEMGYLAFIFDFCGGCLIGRSSGKTTDMSVLTEKDDLAAVIRYVSSLPYVDKNRISLLGCSQGGFVSAMVAADTPERISSLALLYPAFCIPDDARKGRMMFAKFDPANVPEKIRCGPMRLGAGYVKAVQNMDPYDAIRGYTGPVLYLHGTADNIVDISYARRAEQEYPNCEYHEIDGGEHMFRGKHDRIAQEYIKAFFKSQDTHEIPAIHTG
ncbi:MAG: lysophospholipase [Clostridia bacterium]|nr:lysophospholipase [Clostridia bacterium]